MSESRLEREYEALLWECEGLEQEIDELKMKMGGIEVERDALRRKVCKIQSLTMDARTPEQIAAELGWDCFLEDTK